MDTGGRFSLPTNFSAWILTATRFADKAQEQASLVSFDNTFCLPNGDPYLATLLVSLSSQILRTSPQWASFRDSSPCVTIVAVGDPYFM